MDNPQKPPSQRLSLGGGLVIAGLVALLAAAIWYAAGIWQSLHTVHMSGFGWLFLVLGVVVTFLLGAGLMALVFYSARNDFDR